MRKTVILPFGSPEYRNRVVLDRKINPESTKIRDDLTIVPDTQTCRFLGAWVGNDVSYMTPWPEVIENISRDLSRWNSKRPTLEGRRHIINMFIGGKTQYLTRVQGMPKETEEILVRMRDDFLWEGKKPRIAHQTMCLPLNEGGKQILDIQARNEAIDLWNLKEFLREGDDRANWPFFVERTVINRWNMNQTANKHGSLYNIFLQNIHVPQWRIKPLAYDIRRMFKAAKKYHLEFTALSISREIQLQMPIWNHIALIESKFDKICRKDAVKCLRCNHQVLSVEDILRIATRKTTLYRQPHVVNPSGIGRKNCGCPLCRRDRNEFGCKNPGECVEAAKFLLECIQPKWSPIMPSEDLCDLLKLSEAEKARNNRGGKEDDTPLTFDPDFRLNDISHGFRIFAFEDHTTQFSTKRYNMPNDEKMGLDVYLHAKVKYPGEARAEMNLMLLVRQDNETKINISLLLSFSNKDIYPSFNSTILGGLLYVTQEVPKDIPLTVHCSSNFLGNVLVTHRVRCEGDPLDPLYPLIQSVISALQERTGRVFFRKVDPNPAKGLYNLNPTPMLLDTEPDLMFSNPGFLLKDGTQRLFTKLIKTVREKPIRKSTTHNLERVRCSIEDEFNYQPTDSAIWTSIRSTNIHRLTRNFLWKSIHNIFHVGSFWDHVPNLEILGQCTMCRVPESLEHIMLECNAPGQLQIWRLVEILWRLRYTAWPKLNWGILLGCTLAKFKSPKGNTLPAQNRFFTIIVSTSMYLIWKLRNERVFETFTPATSHEIHNRWVATINSALKRDRLLANRARFGSLAIKKQLVLNTWSGTLLDEDSLPDDWIKSKGVLVGIRPATRKHGVG
jgi:hypothetical protein